MGTLYILRAVEAATLDSDRATIAVNGQEITVQLQANGSLLAGSTHCPSGRLQRVPWHVFPVLWCPAQSEAVMTESVVSVTEMTSVAANVQEIVVGGGFDSEFKLASHEVQAYNPFTATWRSLAPTLILRDEHSVASSGHKLVVVGNRGFMSGFAEEIEEYNGQAWKRLAGRLPQRKGCTAVYVGTARLLVIGGTQGKHILRCCLEHTGTGWQDRSRMSLPRTGHGAAYVEPFVYVFGGDSGRANEWNTENSVERYDPTTNRWHLLAPMQLPRRHFGIAVIGHYIYLIGGETCSSECLARCDRYDTLSGQWSALKPLQYARSFLTAAAIDGKLYAIGGKDATGNIDNIVEAHDPAMAEWTTLPRMPGGGKWGLAAAVLSRK